MQLNLAENMKEIRDFLEQGDMEGALKLSGELVRCADENRDYVDDEKCEYYSFSDFFEEILVKEFMSSGREIIRAEFPFADVYYQHGILLSNEKRYEEAREVLAKARRWNPTSALIAFAYMDALRSCGDLEEYMQLARDTFPYLFRSADVAQCYSNFAGYYAAKEQWSIAAACCYLSLEYEPDNVAVTGLLQEIKKKTGEEMKVLKIEKARKIAQKDNIPTEPNSNIIKLAAGMGEQFMAKQIFDGAQYCFKIVYDLTKDEKIGQLVEQMKMIM